MLLTSCMDSVNESSNITYYALNQDSTLTLFYHGSTLPIYLTKPIDPDRAKFLDIPDCILNDNPETIGMHRYVNGELNDSYKISNSTELLLFSLALLSIISVTKCIYGRK